MKRHPALWLTIILAFSLPDLWLVSAPWLGQEADR
jgi:hypothetical protein